jgi:peptidoglycan-N-acetylglucosamine deacetylase
VIESPAKVLEMWKGELDAMRRHGCLFMLTCHPFLSGRAGRVEALRALIEYALDLGDVEFATGAQIAERTLADDGLAERALAPVEVDPETYPLE